MTRYVFWMSRYALTVVAALTICGVVRAAEKPNILFIFSDDQAFDTVHALGQTEIETPNLDRLVARGTTFTHAYNQGGWHGAVCVASRTMLVTGRFLWHARDAEKNLKSDYVAKGRMWPQLLEKAGYDTYFSGKWHIKADATKTFGTVRHVRPGMPNQTKQGYDRPHEGKADVWKPWDKKFGGFWKGGKHWSEVLGDDAVDFLGTAAKSDKPFFMYLAFNAPHDPRQSPKQYVDKYPLDKIALPKPFLKDYPYNIGSNRSRDEKLAPFPRTEYSVKVNRQEYYAIISHMDAQIGRILKALEKTGKADNTFVFFTADHGLACGHHGLMGKQNMYDHSVRVPFVVAGPNITPGKKIAGRIYMQDVMATTLDLADIEKPDHVQFNSLVPVLNGQRASPYEATYGAYVDVQRMVTHGDHKLIRYPKIGKTLLFDLKADPWETKNLANDPAYAKRVADLNKKLKTLQQEMGDTLNLDSGADSSPPVKKKSRGKASAAG